jgi:hypothetical protein
MLKLKLKLPFWQFLPKNPGLHVHAKPFSFGLQIAASPQGFE